MKKLIRALLSNVCTTPKTLTRPIITVKTFLLNAFLICCGLAFFALWEALEERQFMIDLENRASRLQYDPNAIESLSSLDILDPNILLKGKHEMANHKVVICGITRDNSKDLPSTITHLKLIASMFQDYRVIIFENDSNDGTKEMLYNWAKLDSKIKIISENYNITKRPSIKFLAEIRNKYLKTLESDPEYKSFDMVIVADMDMFFGIDPRGIEDSFSKIDKWDAVCSNGIYTKDGHMWDCFAFRNDEFPLGPNEEINYRYTTGRACNKKIYKVGTELVPVASCFGGLSIYKRKAIEGCFYDVIAQDCEHVLLNKCISNKNAGRIFLNPNQVLRYLHYK